MRIAWPDGQRPQREVEAGDDPCMKTIASGSTSQPYGAPPLDDQLAQSGRLHTVAIDGMLDAAAERLHNGGRRGEIHIGDPERQIVLAAALPLHAVAVTTFDDAVEVIGHGRPPLECLLLLLEHQRQIDAWFLGEQGVTGLGKLRQMGQRLGDEIGGLVLCDEGQSALAPLAADVARVTNSS